VARAEGTAPGPRFFFNSAFPRLCQLSPHFVLLPSLCLPHEENNFFCTPPRQRSCFEFLLPVPNAQYPKRDLPRCISLFLFSVAPRVIVYAWRLLEPFPSFFARRLRFPEKVVRYALLNGSALASSIVFSFPFLPSGTCNLKVLVWSCNDGNYC